MSRFSRRSGDLAAPVDSLKVEFTGSLKKRFKYKESVSYGSRNEYITTIFRLWNKRINVDNKERSWWDEWYENIVW